MVLVVVEFIQLCGRKTKQQNKAIQWKIQKTYNTKTSTTSWMVIGDKMLMKFGKSIRNKCLVFSGTAGQAWKFVCRS